MGTITATTENLALALGTVIHAASKDAARPILHGVYLESYPRGGLRCVAADNYRIAVAPVENGTADESLILHLDSAAELLRMVKKERVSTDLTITTDDPGHATATWGRGSSLGLQVIDGVFPNYQQVLPVSRDGDRTIGLDAATIAEAAKAHAPGARRGAERNVRVTVNADPLAPIVVRPQVGTSFEVIMPVRLS